MPINVNNQPVSHLQHMDKQESVKESNGGIKSFFSNVLGKIANFFFRGGASPEAKKDASMVTQRLAELESDLGMGNLKDKMDLNAMRGFNQLSPNAKAFLLTSNQQGMDSDAAKKLLSKMNENDFADVVNTVDHHNHSKMNYNYDSSRGQSSANTVHHHSHNHSKMDMPQEDIYGEFNVGRPSNFDANYQMNSRNINDNVNVQEDHTYGNINVGRPQAKTTQKNTKLDPAIADRLDKVNENLTAFVDMIKSKEGKANESNHISEGAFRKGGAQMQAHLGKNNRMLPKEAYGAGEIRYSDIGSAKATNVTLADGSRMNANKIDVGGVDLGYACQAPKANTFEKQFKMILQKDITMLTSLMSDNDYKDDCKNRKNTPTETPYFAHTEGTQFFGSIEVKSTKKDYQVDCGVDNQNNRLNGSIYELEIKDNSTRPATNKKINVLHVENWPDKQPIPGSSAVKIAAAMDAINVGGGKTLTHCRAGVGRTGEVLMAKAMMDPRTQNMPMSTMINDMRSQRNHVMVQTSGQFNALADIATAQARTIGTLAWKK